MFVDFNDGWWCFSVGEEPHRPQGGVDIRDWSDAMLIEFFNLPNDRARLEYIYQQQLVHEYKEKE